MNQKIVKDLLRKKYQKTLIQLKKLMKIKMH